MKALVVAREETIKTLNPLLHQRWPEATLLSVADAVKAKETVASESLDIVILDLDTADGDGFDVLEQIHLSSHPPLIALVSSHAETDRVRALELGADACIAKPVPVAEFSARVKALLRRAMWLSQKTLPRADLANGGYTNLVNPLLPS